MSGGFFEPVDLKLRNFYDDLNEALYTKELLLEEETIKVLQEILIKANHLSELIRNVDLLYSSDISEESFMAAIRELEDEKIKEKNLKEVKPCSISDFRSGNWVKCTESGLPAKIYRLLQGNRMSVRVMDTQGNTLYIEDYFSDGSPVGEGEPLKFPGIIN